ncbi:MAG TPA: hypothetical protein PLF26_06780, partial [Blastocatellia bacterium]|nr:hypothetical protein [Blastocatellia bacterium]
GGLAAACFVRAFGISFLGLPRSDTSSHAHESGWSMRTGMALLAGASVALGLLPSVVAPALARVGAQFEGLRVPVPFPRFGLSIATPSGLSSMSPLGIAALLVITVALVHLTLRALGRAKPVRLGSTWGCGRYGQTPRMQYTAMAFAEPLRRIFAAIYRPTEDVSIDFHPASRYFVERIHYASDLPESFAAYVYNPLLAAARAIATRVRRVQVGSVHAYLLYLALTVLVALVAARVWH